VSAALLIVRKDLRVLGRSPALLGVLVAYPLVIALLVGLVAGYSTSKPRVAFVDEDHLPEKVEIAGQTFHVDRTIEAVSKTVRLERMSRDEAERKLASGQVVGVVTVPPGFIATLKGLQRSPALEFERTRGDLSARVEQQMQALVYSLNRLLQGAFIDANLRYVNLIRDGGRGSFAGREFDLLGLRGVERELATLPRTRETDDIRDFVRAARLALDETDDALRATANPIELDLGGESGRSWVLSAAVQSYALALTLSFLALMLAAAALAAERDENVVARLARGLVTLGQLVWAKILLAAVVALGLGVAIAIAFGVIVEVAPDTGGHPWGRVPLLLVGVVLAGAALGALGSLLGALSREARTASLVALLVTLPIVFLGLVPREVVPAAGWLSNLFPFSHAVRFFSASLFDSAPWGRLSVEGAWLAGLCAVYGLGARAAARRLLA
jgi:ABC-2 type transport system permease protein